MVCHPGLDPGSRDVILKELDSRLRGNDSDFKDFRLWTNLFFIFPQKIFFKFEEIFIQN